MLGLLWLVRFPKKLELIWSKQISQPGILFFGHSMNELEIIYCLLVSIGAIA